MLSPSLHASIKNRTFPHAIALKNAIEPVALSGEVAASQQYTEAAQQKWSEFGVAAIHATPSACKQPGGRRWWNLRCSHSNRFFVGLYSAPERDHILKHFKGRRHQVEPLEFSFVAAQAITFYTQGVRS